MARRKVLLVCLMLSLTCAAEAQLPADVKRALAARDYETAIAWLRPNAQSGDPDAAFELGKLYRLGKGVEEDRSKAAQMFEIAAQSGHPEAQHLLALHRESEGDLDSATILMRQAADSGHAKAQRWLSDSRSRTDERSLFDRIAGHAPAGRDFDAAELTVVDDQSMTPLMMAVRSESADWTRTLLAAGADPDVQDRLGNTALHYAVSAENLELTTLLLNAGATTAAKMTSGSTALHLATASGNVPITRALLDAGADRQQIGEGGWSATQLAARSNDAGLRALFGLQKQDPSAGRSTASTLQRSLARAAREGNVKEIDRLIRAGADPDQQDASGQPAVVLAIQAGQPEAVELLMKRSTNHSTLQQAITTAAAADQPDILQQLLTRQPDSKTDHNRIDDALFAAVNSDCAACLPLLLQAGADPASQTPGGESLLLSAVKQGHSDSALALIPALQAFDTTDAHARTPLWWASKLGQTDVCRLLLTQGAAMRVDEDGLTPLHIAAAEDQAEVVELLVSRMDIDTTTPSGNSALILAAGRDALGSVDVLLQSGAQVELRNNAGNTALIIATQANAFDVASRLMEAGASPTARNKQFESARSIAANGGEERWQNLLADNSKNGLLSLFN